ncbi:hypothetical protein DASB73_016330 [Starmerella bacillaris]|uniref:SH3 domain-containing protein n=1 Tax=Starmerella bacillaris TaxID=1247836 RepID=A0AAV5RGW7_STABA|nr:hypothetical protein DASB73_016330 [Starmerella bacillaris]
MAQYPLSIVLSVAIPLGVFSLLSLLVLSALILKYIRYTDADRKAKLGRQKRLESVQGLYKPVHNFNPNNENKELVEIPEPASQGRSLKQPSDIEEIFELVSPDLVFKKHDRSSSLTVSSEAPKMDIRDSFIAPQTASPQKFETMYNNDAYEPTSSHGPTSSLRDARGSQYRQNSVRYFKPLTPENSNMSSLNNVRNHKNSPSRVHRHKGRASNGSQEVPPLWESQDYDTDFDFFNDSPSGTLRRPVSGILGGIDKEPFSTPQSSLPGGVINSPGPLPRFSPPRPPTPNVGALYAHAHAEDTDVKKNNSRKENPKSSNPVPTPSSVYEANSKSQASHLNASSIYLFGGEDEESSKNNPAQMNSDGVIVNLHGAGVFVERMYRAKMADELDIDVDDYLQVYEVFDDGWCNATIISSVKPLETKTLITGVCPMASLNLRPKLVLHNA